MVVLPATWVCKLRSFKKFVLGTSEIFDTYGQFCRLKNILHWTDPGSSRYKSSFQDIRPVYGQYQCYESWVLQSITLQANVKWFNWWVMKASIIRSFKLEPKQKKSSNFEYMKWSKNRKHKEAQSLLQQINAIMLKKIYKGTKK